MSNEKEKEISFWFLLQLTESTMKSTMEPNTISVVNMHSRYSHCTNSLDTNTEEKMFDTNTKGFDTNTKELDTNTKAIDTNTKEIDSTEEKCRNMWNTESTLSLVDMSRLVEESRSE